MTAITLTLKDLPQVPLEAETLSPDVLSQLAHDEICGAALQYGKRRLRVDDFFTVQGERSDQVHLHGDLSRVKWIGRGMTHGRIVVHGHAGMHLGAYMRGGEIAVHGNAGDWIGAEMEQGLIRVHGHAGGQIGGAYRGSTTGMRNGLILVDGDAGLEVGTRMKKGMIVIGGRAKDFVGLQMKGGTILLCGGAELRTGAWMIRGTIISLQPLPLLPTFLYDCAQQPTIIRLLARYLRPHGVELPDSAAAGVYQFYSGDTATFGKGELLIWQPRTTSAS